MTDERIIGRVEFAIAAAWIIAVIVATMQQGVTHENNNFLIFRAASQHLMHGQDLYAAYPAEHHDLYKYSPTFAVLFLPFAVLPVGISMLLWNALNAGVLYAGIGMVLPRRGAAIARGIVFLDMLGSLQNVQSNALVAGLIIMTFATYERRHTVLGTFAAEIGAVVKVFPLAGLSFAIFHPRKVRVALAILLGFVVLTLLPLIVTSPAMLMAQYDSWRSLEASDALERGISLMEMTHLLFRQDWPNWPQQLAGLLLLVAPVLVRRERWGEWTFRMTYLCSVLVFCIVFNHQAESPTFVVGVAGAGIWFAALARPTRLEWALLGFVVVGTILPSSDAMPDVVQRELFDRYKVKVVPLIVLWVLLQVRLWQTKTTPRDAENAHADGAATAV